MDGDIEWQQQREFSTIQYPLIPSPFRLKYDIFSAAIRVREERDDREVKLMGEHLTKLLTTEMSCH
jgi:hypothetical protein